MNTRQNELHDDTCWVYIRQEDDGSYLIGITYHEEFRQREWIAGRPLLLWRKFEDTLSAAGYRIVLKKLSRASLEKLIAECGSEEPNNPDEIG